MVLITFCTVDKKMYYIHICPERTIEEAKQIYVEHTGGINSNLIKLVYNKKVLHDRATIHSLGLKEKDMIIVIDSLKKQSNEQLQKEEKLPEVRPLPLSKANSLYNKSSRPGTKKEIKILQKIPIHNKQPLIRKIPRQNVRRVLVIRIIPNNLLSQRRSQIANLGGSKLLNPFIPIHNRMFRSHFPYFNSEKPLKKHASMKPSFLKIKVQIFKKIRFYMQIQFHIFVFLLFTSLLKQNENHQKQDKQFNDQ